MSSDIVNLVNRAIELPTVPEVLVKINGMINDLNVSADELGQVISKDPAVSTNILRIVNSAYNGLQVRVSSVTLAVSVMGFEMTKKVALKAAVFSVFASKSKALEHFDPLGFWKHSIFTGVAARTLGESSPRFSEHDPEDLYICGLLHDIGKIILMEKANSEYLPILKQAAAENRSEIDLETDTLGYNHADLGSVLAIKWFLSEDLTTAIRYHHTPSKDPYHQDLSSLIHIADHLAWTSGNPSTVGTPMPQMENEVYDHVGLDPQQVEDLLPQIHEDYVATGLPW